MATPCYSTNMELIGNERALYSQTNTPKLFYVDSTQHSIFLRWETWSSNREDTPIYRIEMKDETYAWVTKYWGMKTECEIKNLGPETLYYFRLGISSELGGEEIKSEILTTATKDASPMLFYLIKSAERGDIRSLSAFLSERKDSGAVDGFDKNGETPLIKAVKNGDPWVVKKLLACGAGVNQGAYGTCRSPLMYACFLGHKDLATTLLQAGADIHLPDCNKCVALHYAADSNNLEMVKLCIDFGANVNLQDSVGWTPLMRAVIFSSNKEIIGELIERGSNLRIKDRNGKTALELAKINNENTVVELLESSLIEPEEILESEMEIDPKLTEDLEEPKKQEQTCAENIKTNEIQTEETQDEQLNADIEDSSS